MLCVFIAVGLTVFFLARQGWSVLDGLYVPTRGSTTHKPTVKVDKSGKWGIYQCNQMVSLIFEVEPHLQYRMLLHLRSLV